MEGQVIYLLKNLITLLLIIIIIIRMLMVQHYFWTLSSPIPIALLPFGRHPWIFFCSTSHLAQTNRCSTKLQIRIWRLENHHLARSWSIKGLLTPAISSKVPSSSLVCGFAANSWLGVGETSFDWWIERRKSAVAASLVSVLQPSGCICCKAELEKPNLQQVVRREW